MSEKSLNQLDGNEFLIKNYGLNVKSLKFLIQYLFLTKLIGIR